MVSQGTPGQDVRLTIDAGLQLSVEQELLAAYVADRPRASSAVVMDPYTGEVYAEATYPSYDANDYRAIAAKDPNRFIDPVVSSVYEPGSVFKMMTATAALEHKTATLMTRVKDTVDAAARRRPGPYRRRRPDGDGLDDVPGRRRLLAQRRGRQGRPGPRPEDPRRGRDPVRHMAEARVRRQDRHRPRRRGVRPRARPPASTRGPRSTSPTAPSARAWRSRRSSSPRPTPR